MSGWADRSGNNNHAAQPTLGNRPTLVPTMLNGYPVISFDGVNDQLAVPDANSLDLTQWDMFLVNSVSTAKTNNVWFAKASSTQPNYGLWSPVGNSLTMPIYDIFGLFSGLNTPAGAVGASSTLIEYTNTLYLGIFPSRGVNRFGASIYTDITALQLPRTNNAPLNIGNATGAAGWNLDGSIAEFFMYNSPINPAQRIIVNNYLAAKYNFTLAVNDIYMQDNGPNGDYDHEMAGIGRISSSSMHTDAQGSGVVRINNASGLGNNEFLLWGHDNGILGSWGSTDYPTGLDGRWFRVWRVSEVGPTGAVVDVGNVDMTFDLTNQGPVTATDLRLLVDLNNNGLFADDTPIPTLATNVGGNLYRFAGISQLVNGRRFTLGTINWTQTPLPVELLYFNAKCTPDRMVELGWATASEHDNSHFSVERSVDGAQWEELMDVAAVGNSTTTTIYSELDRTPLAELSYYRLRQVDEDGASTVSNVVPVRFETPHDVVVFPDPAQDVVNVLFRSTYGAVEVRLINEMGQVVHVPIITQQGSARMDVGLLPAGNYAVMVITDTQVVTTRLIVAR